MRDWEHAVIAGMNLGNIFLKVQGRVGLSGNVGGFEVFGEQLL